MVQVSTEKRLLVYNLFECIAEAMSHLDDVDPIYGNKTKLQKLLDLIIDEYNLPVTYNWYLAGAVLPGEQATSSNLQSAVSTLPRMDSPSTRDTEDGSEPNRGGHSVETDGTELADATTEDFVGAREEEILVSTGESVGSSSEDDISGNEEKIIELLAEERGSDCVIEIMRPDSILSDKRMKGESRVTGVVLLC